jgi:hypothetical protein
MKRRTNLLALLGAGLVTVLAVAGFSMAASPTAAPTLQTAPTISGTPEQGQTLTATSGSWSSSSSVTYRYQWRRCNSSGAGCSNIGGADNSTYQVKAADVGHTLRVRVTARNTDGSSQADSNPTAVVKAKAPAPLPTGCPTGSGTVSVNDISLPARMNVDGQQSSPTVISRSTSDLTVKFHVSACGGRSVSGALVYVTAVPFEQFSIPAEVPTDSTGWATLTMHQDRFFPASPRQQLLAMFVRARKSGESLLGGVSTRKLVSFPVRL